MRMLTLLLPLFAMGCFAPLHSPGISASLLPDEYRMPTRTNEPRLTLSQLVAPQSSAYRIGRGDKLEIIAPDLIADGDSRSFIAEVLPDNTILLPRIGAVEVGNRSIREAQLKINETLSKILNDPQVSIRILEYGVVRVIVLGEVTNPGTYELRRNENDVAHAIAAAGGFTEFADDAIELHHKHPARKIAEFKAGKDDVVIRANNDHSEPTSLMTGFRGATYSTPSVYAQSSASHPVASETSASHPVAAIPVASIPAPANTSSSHTPELETSFLSLLNDGHSTRVRTIRHDSPSTPVGSDLDRDAIPVNSQMVEPNKSVKPTVASATFNSAMTGTTEPAKAHEFPGFDQPFTRLSLRGYDVAIPDPNDVILSDGDVVVVPQMKQRVFYVVGPLSRQFASGFVLDLKQREIGNGFLLPKNREVDVLTAVAMAGYIDPISSPTTVTLQRRSETGETLLVRVDLIQARANTRENLFVQPGDIIYLNPDGNWWFRRMFDRILPAAVSGYVSNLPD